MESFARDDKPVRSAFFTLRATPEEIEQLDRLAEILGVRNRGEVLRAALDYYLTHSPKGKAAARALRGK